MPLYKITWDFNKCVSYVVRHAVVHYNPCGTTTVRHLSTIERVCLMRKAGVLGSIDTVVEPERKMFWLAFAPILRTMGVIK